MEIRCLWPHTEMCWPTVKKRIGFTPWCIFSANVYAKIYKICFEISTPHSVCRDSKLLVGYPHRGLANAKRALIVFISWWRHQMEAFSALQALCQGNSRSPVNSPHKNQWRGAFIFSLICAWTNSWVSNREAGDLRRHYDVTVMY